jgi:hypothetical protein
MLFDLENQPRSVEAERLQEPNLFVREAQFVARLAIYDGAEGHKKDQI